MTAKRTRIAKLRIDQRTPTRIVRREVDVSMRMTLRMLARTIRAATGLHDAKRHCRYEIGGGAYGSAPGGGAGGRRGNAAMALRLEQVLKDARELVFVHNIERGRRLAIEVREVRDTDEPETAFPRLTDAVGTIEIEALTPDDADHAYTVDADDTESRRHAHAVEMCHDEEKRSRTDLRMAEMCIDQVRLARRGPLRSHQAGSARRGGGGLAPEPATEPKRFGPRRRTAPEALQLPADGSGPTARIVDGRAVFEDDELTALMRELAWRWARGEESDEEDRQRAIRETGKLARKSRGDLCIAVLHARALEAGHEWHPAKALYRQVMEIGEAGLPEGFGGAIDARSETGRAIMNAAQGLGRTECEYGSSARGIEAYERALEWNEDPHSEARVRLGSEYVKAGRLKEAKALIARYDNAHAMYLYDLTLAAVIEHDWLEAVTNARRALAFGPYIGEILLGNDKPLPVPMGELGGYRSLGEARFYVRRFGWAWKQSKTARALLQWVATHPAAMRERATLREPDHAAARETDDGPGAALAEEFVRRVNAIGDGLSADMMLEAGTSWTGHPWTEIETAIDNGPWWA